MASAVDGHVEVHGSIHRSPSLGQDALERRGLVGGPGIAIQQETMLSHVVLGQSLGHDAVDEIITNQLAGVHHGSGLQTQLRLGADRGSQHVTGRDMHRVVGLYQTGRLGTLSGALASENDETDGGHRYLRKPS